MIKYELRYEAMEGKHGVRPKTKKQVPQKSKEPRFKKLKAKIVKKLEDLSQ